MCYNMPMQWTCSQLDASSSSCTSYGTSTIAIAGPVVAYDPFIDASLGIGLWVLIAVAVVALILKFR